MRSSFALPTFILKPTINSIEWARSMKIPAITAALAALVLCTALAPQAQATSGIRRCVKGEGTGANPRQTAAQSYARAAAASQIVSYLRNGYRADPGSIEKSCIRKAGVFIYRHSLLACKYRHDG